MEGITGGNKVGFYCAGINHEISEGWRKYFAWEGGRDEIAKSSMKWGGGFSFAIFRGNSSIIIIIIYSFCLTSLPQKRRRH